MSEHSHHHHHHHHEDLGDVNRAHWDKHASQYNEKEWAKKMLEYVTEQLRLRHSLFGISNDGENKKQPFRLLDYACGTGNVSKALASFVTQMVGLDVSPKMVERYNEAARASNMSDEVMHAVAGNILSNPPYLLKDDEQKTDESFLQEEKWKDFDAVIIGLGFHHFQDYAGSLRKLGERCKKGGMVGIIDLLPNETFDKTPAEIKKTMHVSGFTEEQMTAFMKEAGLTEVQFVELPDKVYVEMMGSKRDATMFFAVGKKA